MIRFSFYSISSFSSFVHFFILKIKSDLFIPNKLLKLFLNLNFASSNVVLFISSTDCPFPCLFPLFYDGFKNWTNLTLTSRTNWELQLSFEIYFIFIHTIFYLFGLSPIYWRFRNPILILFLLSSHYSPFTFFICYFMSHLSFIFC